MNATLKTKDGKLAVVKHSKDLQLYVKDVQVEYSKRYKVCVHTKGTCLAFFFPSGNRWNVAKVSGDRVKLESTTTNRIESLDMSYLFEWKDLGGGQCLRSAAEPNKHLFVNASDKVMLSSNDQEFALFELVKLDN